MGECQLQQFMDWQEHQLSSLTRHSSSDASTSGGPRLDLVTCPSQPPAEVLQALSRALSFYRTAQLLCSETQQHERETATLGIAYALLRLGRLSACLSALRSLPASLQESVHVRLFTAEALAKLARTKEAIAILESTTGIRLLFLFYIITFMQAIVALVSSCTSTCARRSVCRAHWSGR